ncbi:MAG: permease prefix domain 2-containing transporter [Candidatus Sulfotelmatobacter sp.]
MMTQRCSAQPPRVAAWLIGLFTSDKEAEAVPGDLLEEFSQLAAGAGITFARRWYWRQTARTITHLAGAAFRSAPWMMAAVVVGGFLLHGFVSGLPDKLLSAVTDRYLMFWSAHFRAYLWVLNGMLIEHLVLSMFVGCIVAFVAKGREIVATVTLALVFCAMSAAAFLWVATHGPMYGVGWMLWSCADPLAMVVGGVIVRTRRSRNRDSSPKGLGMTSV